MFTHILTGLYFFFFNDTATTEIYTLSLHDALPISDDLKARPSLSPVRSLPPPEPTFPTYGAFYHPDRKSTRLNSSHSQNSYAVFCLKKKKKKEKYDSKCTTLYLTYT